MMLHRAPWHLSADCLAAPRARRVESNGEMRRDSPLPGPEAGRVEQPTDRAAEKLVVSRERNTRRVRSPGNILVWVMNF